MNRLISRTSILRIFLLFLGCTATTTNAALNLEPDHLTGAKKDAALNRPRRNADLAASALEYMVNLRNQLSEETGEPRLLNEDDPTEVWALQDSDILQELYREKPRTSERCTSMNRYIFNWTSLAKSQQRKVLPVKKGTLRVYLEVIPRLLNGDQATTVDVEVYMNLLGRNSSSRVEAGRHQLSVTGHSNAWIELNITEGVQSLWPPKENESRVEITVMLRTDCVSAKRVPMIFTDPTSINPTQVRRRQRHLALQPLFLIYLSDEEIKEIIKREKMASEEEDEATILDARNRRSASNQICQAEDFYISFVDLRLDYVLVPLGYNAKQCRGSCSHSTLSQPKNSNLGNNHAKIMASAKILSQIKPEIQFDSEPKEPCCVPEKYKSMTVIIPKGEGIELLVYPHMIVESCKCK